MQYSKPRIKYLQPRYQPLETTMTPRSMATFSFAPATRGFATSESIAFQLRDFFLMILGYPPHFNECPY